MRRSGQTPPTCREMVEMITGYLEGTLSGRDRRRFERHLAGCEHCTEYLAQMRKTLALTGKLVADDIPSEVREQFERIYRRWRSGRHVRSGETQNGSTGGESDAAHDL